MNSNAGVDMVSNTPEHAKKPLKMHPQYKKVTCPAVVTSTGANGGIGLHNFADI